MDPSPFRPLAHAALALALASCRAFPAGLYAPDSVLDALEGSSCVEELDERALASEVQAALGRPVTPAGPARGTYWRLDGASPLGPLWPPAFDSSTGAATAGLESGDILMVKNPHAQSLGTTMTFERFVFYDHLGVLVEREGQWLVCDSWPRFHPFVKAEDFASHFRGGVRVTPLSRFLAHYETTRLVRLPDPVRNARLAAAALDSLADRIEYDPHHDPADPRLSCSEYVLQLLIQVGYQTPEAPLALTSVASMRSMLADLGFRNDEFYAPDQFGELDGAREVGWISRHPSRAAARAIEVAFELLHERFSREGRIADLLRADRKRLLGYPANVERFLAWAEGAAAALGDDRELLRAELGRLLPLFFRPRTRP